MEEPREERLLSMVRFQTWVSSKWAQGGDRRRQTNSANTDLSDRLFLGVFFYLERHAAEGLETGA